MKKPKLRLPRGAKLCPAFKATIGSWVEMEYDAVVVRLGITWYRIKDGMDGSGKREDWVADLPEFCVSVSDYNWRPSRRMSGRFKFYRSFNAAIIGELQQVLIHARNNLPRIEETVRQIRRSIATLKAALKHE